MEKTVNPTCSECGREVKMIKVQCMECDGHFYANEHEAPLNVQEGAVFPYDCPICPFGAHVIMVQGSNDLK